MSFSDCSKIACDKGTETIYKIESNNNEIAIVGYGSDGKNIYRQVVSESDWYNHNQSFLRYKISFIESFGFQLTAKSLNEATCPPTVSTPPCYQLILDGANRAGMKTELTFLFQRNPVALVQIINYQQKDQGIISRTITQKLIKSNRETAK